MIFLRSRKRRSHAKQNSGDYDSNEAKFERRQTQRRAFVVRRISVILLLLVCMKTIGNLIFAQMKGDQKREQDRTNISAWKGLREWKERRNAATELVPKANIFEWKCWDKCSCLPPIIPQYEDSSSGKSHSQNTKHKRTITMHQSYKTSDSQTWHWGWKTQRRTWIDLHPEWFFIFWNDQQNELLAKCIGYEDVLKGRTGIQKADLSRLMYLHRYGGFYSDMDYIALQNHQRLFDQEQNQVKNQRILLQGREDQVVGFEWGYARSPEHPLWTYCLDHARKQKHSTKKACPIMYTGPMFLKRCIRKYFKLRTAEVNEELANMVSYGKDDFMILEPRLIAPIRGDDFASECGKWRNITDEEKQMDGEEITWSQKWPESACKQQLMENGTYAVTFYSHSWGDGLKC